MALTFPAALCFENAATTANITASNSLPLCPPSKLQTDQVGDAWCAETDTAYLTVALATATTGDTFGLFGLNVDTTAVTRIRASLNDASAVDGAVYDSGSAAGRVSPYYGNLVGLMPSPASFKYVRYDLSQAGIARLMAGFTMIGLRNQALINFSYGAQDTPVDLSIVTAARSGAEWIDERNNYREWDFNFEFLSATERFGWIEDCDQLIGQKKNVMMIRDCSSTNLGRDTLLGRVSVGAPTVSAAGFIGGGNIYTKAYKIKQRL
jgi:hypothetical protein